MLDLRRLSRRARLSKVDFVPALESPPHPKSTSPSRGAFTIQIEYAKREFALSYELRLKPL